MEGALRAPRVSSEFAARLARFNAPDVLEDAAFGCRVANVLLSSARCTPANLDQTGRRIAQRLAAIRDGCHMPGKLPPASIHTRCRDTGCTNGR